MKEIVNQQYLLCKMPEKGGWTYLVVREIPKSERKKHGMNQLSGSLDGYELPRVSLMPMKDGGLFMPVNAEIRKAIRKEAGEMVTLVLYHTAMEEEILDARETLWLCLGDEPLAQQNFLAYSEADQQIFIDWIEAASSDEVKVDRLTKSIDLILNKRRIK